MGFKVQEDQREHGNCSRNYYWGGGKKTTTLVRAVGWVKC